MSDQTKIVAIVGPTGSGKTGLAIQLAKQFGGEVISADSRQVYRELNIGTEKVTVAEMEGVPHHLLDICDTGDVYTATDFKRDAAAAIADITDRGKLPIIAGGTFFYIDILLGRISTPTVSPNFPLREQLEQLDTETLYAQLQAHDPVRASTIDQQNKRRLVRALEVVDALGTVPKHINEAEEAYTVLHIGLEVQKEILRTRLHTRAAEALERGLVDETRKLLEGGTTRDRLNEIGLEYRLVIEHLDGKLSEADLLQKLEEKNWQYAKRQMTWLKRDNSIRWFSPTDVANIRNTVHVFLNN